MAGDLNTRRKFKPVDGGGQQVNIGASANRSSALTIGRLYHITAMVDCWIVVGSNTVDAVAGEDYFLPANQPCPYIPSSADEAYISVIQESSALSAGLKISQASE